MALSLEGARLLRQINEAIQRIKVQNALARRDFLAGNSGEVIPRIHVIHRQVNKAEHALFTYAEQFGLELVPEDEDWWGGEGER